MRTIVLTLLIGAALFGPAAAKGDDRLATIHLPEGFVIEPFAEVPNARQMAWGEKGTLFVGTRREGRVFAVTDEDGDGRGERVRAVASGLRMPSGVAFRDGALYVAAVSTILRFDDIGSRLDDPPTPVIRHRPAAVRRASRLEGAGIRARRHLYFPVGAPCDVCRTEGYHGTILRMRPNGSGIEIYARGLRNSVGLAWHPVTGELWFTDKRQRSPGRGPAARRVEQGSGSGPPLRVPVLPCRHAARSRFRRRRPLRRQRGARTGPGRARRAARPRHSFRNQRAESLSGRGVYCGTRTRKPERNDWLPGLGRAPRRRPQNRAGLRGICPRMVRQRAGVGTAGRHPGGTRRLNLGVRRSGGENLPHPVRG